MRLAGIVLSLLLIFSLVSASQTRSRDPLTSLEVDQLREAAQNPPERLKLWMKFARARMTAIDQLRGDPKLAQDRGQHIHDLLEDLGSIMDEIDDNFENFARDHEDIRKALKLLVEMDSEFQVKLRAIKEGPQANSAEARDYQFALQNTIEAVNGNADDARQTLDEQNQLAKDKKLKKPVS